MSRAKGNTTLLLTHGIRLCVYLPERSLSHILCQDLVAMSLERLNAVFIETFIGAAMPYLVSSVFSMLVSFNVTFCAKVSRDVKKFNINACSNKLLGGGVKSIKNM